MKTELTNRELLLLIQKDDRVAFHKFYERYSKRLFSFALRFLKQEVDAEGIVQEVFIRIWQTRKKIDLNSSLESYLFTVAYNLTLNLLRKRMNERKYLDYIKLKQVNEKAPDLFDEIQYRELTGKLQFLLNHLTPRQKEIFELSRKEGLSNIEIANRLDISENTVKKHLSISLVYLRSKVASVLIINALLVCLFFF